MIVAADIDGTFYFSKEEIKYRQEDLKAIEKWQRKGYLFGVCTGRSDDSARIVLGDTVRPDFYIMTNGSLIRDREDKVLFFQELSLDYVEDILTTFQSYHPTYTSRVENGYQRRLDSLALYDGGHIESMSLLFQDTEEAKCVFPMVEEHSKGKAHVFLNRWHVDIAPYGITKGTAVDFIRKHYGEKVAGIGDTYVDTPLLLASEISFTFHSSPEEVKVHATHLVDTMGEALDILLQNNP